MSTKVTTKDFKKGQFAYIVSKVPVTKFDPNEVPIIAATVKSAGAKYVTLDMAWCPKFQGFDDSYLIETGDTAFQGRILFPTENAAKEYLEQKSLINWFESLRVSQLTFEQLRLVKAILEPELIDTTSQRIEVIDGAADTVSELMMLLTKVPGNYDVSLSGMNTYAIAVDHVDKSILLDDVNWIEQHVDEFNEEQERIENKGSEE